MHLIVCSACRGSRLASMSPASGVELLRCQDCGSSQTNPRPTLLELETNYSQAYYGPENVKFIPALEQAVNWITQSRVRKINSLLKPGSKVLEIGCGRGLLLKSLSQLGHECHGTERSALAAARASRTAGIKVYTQALHECGLPGSYFDLVILWHVLEHLEDPRETLGVIFRLTKPDGQLLLEVPNYSSLQARLSGKHWFHLDMAHHLHHFSRSGLQRLLINTGFRLSKTSTFNLEQCPYGALQSFLNLLGLPKEQLYQILKREINPSAPIKLINCLLAAMLLLPATLFSFLEASVNRGGVLRVVAQRNENVLPNPADQDAH